MSDDAFVTSVRIEAEPEDVFPYLTDAALMCRWMGEWAELDAVPEIEISLHRDGDATVVELVHRDLPPEERPDHGVGWGHFLERLVLAAGGGDPEPDPWARR